MTWQAGQPSNVSVGLGAWQFSCLAVDANSTSQPSPNDCRFFIAALSIIPVGVLDGEVFISKSLNSTAITARVLPFDETIKNGTSKIGVAVSEKQQQQQQQQQNLHAFCYSFFPNS
jgi:hypothetical protein